MLDQHQINAMAEKFRAESSEITRQINGTGRGHLDYLNQVENWLEQLLAVVREQKQRFVHFERPAVEQIAPRRAPQLERKPFDQGSGAAQG